MSFWLPLKGAIRSSAQSSGGSSIFSIYSEEQVYKEVYTGSQYSVSDIEDDQDHQNQRSIMINSMIPAVSLKIEYLSYYTESVQRRYRDQIDILISIIFTVIT